VSTSSSLPGRVQKLGLRFVLTLSNHAFPRSHAQDHTDWLV
jgi:hypothetical protein